VRRLIIGLSALLACTTTPSSRRPVPACIPDGTRAAEPPHGLAWPTFGGERGRTAWDPRETILTPSAIAAHGLRQAWESPQLDSIAIGGQTYAPHAYASPLYADDVPILECGARMSVLFVATSNGYVHAISAFDATANGGFVKAGTVLWSTALSTPIVIPKLDGGMPLGVLSTPVLDLGASPPTLYVAAIDAARGWQVHALDATTGTTLPRWPVTIDDASTRLVNRNGPAHFEDATVLSQRGALALSEDGGTLYVPFGAYFDGGVGWMVAVSTRSANVIAAHSSARTTEATASGGIWSAGGPSIDSDGVLYATTGNSPNDSAGVPHVWGESLLAWRAPLELSGTYTPFNYCALDVSDSDLGGDSPIVLPDFDLSGTQTPRLVAFGSKQGNVYLVDRARLATTLDARQPCSKDSTTDRSLLPPDPQPQFGARGPLNVFGPYSDDFGNLDHAKMRTSPAFYRSGSTSYLVVTGATKAKVDSTQSVAPSIVRLRVVTPPGAAAYLAIDGADPTTVFKNPGAPIVSSDGPNGPVIWVLDENASRLASLVDPNAPHPVLYAVDGSTLQPLWDSGTLLHVGGKYSTPVVAHGVAFVATDRVQAFSLSL